MYVYLQPKVFLNGSLGSTPAAIYIENNFVSIQFSIRNKKALSANDPCSYLERSVVQY